MSQSIRVWDLVVRFGHWTLAALFLTAYFTEGEPTWLHTSAGYGVLIVIAFLLVLLAALTGTAGSGMAYFAAEKGLGPVAAAAALMRGEQLRDDGRYAKVGSKRVLKEVHEVFANVTLALVLVHIAGVVVSSALHRENLVRAMITGRKPAP